MIPDNIKQKIEEKWLIHKVDGIDDIGTRQYNQVNYALRAAAEWGYNLSLERIKELEAEKTILINKLAAFKHPPSRKRDFQ